MKILPKRLNKKTRSLLVIALIILVVASLIFLLVKNLKAPAQGSIEQTPSSQAEKITPYTQPGTYKGKYIAFTYPAHFKALPTKLTGSYLEAAAFGSTDLTSKQIAVGVSKGSINNDGGVSFRRLNPKLYKENSSSRWVEFTKTDGTEDTFFIEHNGLLASVSATAPSSNLNNEAIYAASSLNWR